MNFFKDLCIMRLTQSNRKCSIVGQKRRRIYWPTTFPYQLIIPNKYGGHDAIFILAEYLPCHNLVKYSLNVSRSLKKTDIRKLRKLR